MTRSYASMNEMVELLELAEDHCADAMLPCKYLYRNKSEEYFNDILNYGGGIMETELKDNGGDPRSPINGNLGGIFFTANVRKRCLTGKPLPTSPYGSSRLILPINNLIGPDTYNIYFADFYCIGTNYHYVILVITEYNSEADRFCNLHLHILNWSRNVFLQCDDVNDFKVTVKDLCIIEVMYTQTIDISASYVEIVHNIPVCRRGYNLRKDLKCKICNIRFKRSIFDLKRNQQKRSRVPCPRIGLSYKLISIDKHVTPRDIISKNCNFPVRNNSVILKDYKYSEINNNRPQLGGDSFKMKNTGTILSRDILDHLPFLDFNISPAIVVPNKSVNNVSMTRGNTRPSQMSKIIPPKQSRDINRTSIRGAVPSTGIKHIINPASQYSINAASNETIGNENTYEIITIADVRDGINYRKKIDDTNENDGDKKKEKIKKKSNSCKNCCTVQ